MTLHIQKFDEGFHVLLSSEDMRTLNLREGAAVELTPVTATGPVIEYLTDEQALEAYRATLPQFRAAYEELAK